MGKKRAIIIIITIIIQFNYIQFLQINQLDAQISQVYFGMKFHMFRAVPLSIIRSFSLYT